jgi:hypothetical protein
VEVRSRTLPPALGAAVVFALALALRLLFWQATPDAAWPSSAAYQGDAFVWLGAAQALLEGREVDSGLPLRPPGMAWLLAALGGGRGGEVTALVAVWCLLGALGVLVVHRAVRRDFGAEPALIAGVLCAASTGLLVLSTSLNNETPWLLLTMLSLAGVEPLRRRPALPFAAAWGVLNAAACLVRAEHLLFFVLASAWIALGRPRPRAGRPAAARALIPLALAWIAFAAVLAPWHLRAWSRVAAFNEEPRPLHPSEEARFAAFETTLDWVRWDPEAAAALARLPAFSRRQAGLFVAATLAHRGGRRVRMEDLGILEEAFGALPAPLPERFFVALYGGLNFHLAHNALGGAGFARGPLDAPPPLRGGAQRYPPALVAGLPPADLALVYPPHSAAVAHGYRLGLGWIASNPAEALRRSGAKLRIFWSGAALGWTGYNLPTGLSGLRRNVDLVVPEGVGAGAWRLIVLAACAAGVVAGRRNPALVPWLLFIGSRAATAVVFFGYARVGATAIPVVALLIALAALHFGLGSRASREPPPPSPGRRGRPATAPARRPLTVTALAALLLVIVESARWASGPELWLDGRRAGASDPLPDAHRDLRLEVR